MGNLLKNNVINRARYHFTPGVTFYDTETTGLSDGDEIIDIAVVDIDGTVLIDTLVKPSIPIPLEATGIHNITNKMVEYAPGWNEVWPRVSMAISYHSGVYNLEFDSRMIQQMNKKYSFKRNFPYYPKTHFCVMELFAYFYGEWSRQYNDYVWKNLEFARKFFSLTHTVSHRAKEDALITRDIFLRIANAKLENELVFPKRVNQNSQKINLSGRDLSKADLRGVDLSGAKLINVNLSGSIMDYDTNFTGADLQQSNLAGAYIKGAIFKDANMAGVNLAFSDLLNFADFSGANLENANFKYCFVSPARFKGANLVGIQHNGIEDFRDWSLDENTIMPNGKLYEEWKEDRFKVD